MDALRELPQLVDGAIHLVRDLIRLSAELDLHGERDEPLLNALVQFALDPPAVFVCGSDEPPPGRAQVFDLVAQVTIR